MSSRRRKKHDPLQPPRHTLTWIPVILTSNHHRNPVPPPRYTATSNKRVFLYTATSNQREFPSTEKAQPFATTETHAYLDTVHPTFPPPSTTETPSLRRDKHTLQETINKIS